MKKYFIYSSIVLSALFFGLNHAQAAVVSSSPVVTATSTCSYGLSCGLVGYWTLDGKDTIWSSASAGTTLDKSGNGGTGTLTGMSQSVSSTLGKIGQAINFRGGVGEYIRVADADRYTWGNGTTDSPFSLSAWVFYDTSASGSYSIWPIIGKWSDLGKAEWSFYISYADLVGGQSGNGLTLQINKSGGVTDRIIVEGRTPITPKKWNHVAVTYDGSSTSGGIKIYLNGVLDATDVFTNGTYTAMSNLTAPVDIGASIQNNSSFDAFAKGKIDDVHIYKRALSATEVKQLYGIGAATKQASSPNVTSTSICSTGLSCGLIAYWTFDGKDMINGKIDDESGNGNIMNVSGIATSTFYTTGRIGQALNFDGVNDYAKTASTINFGGTKIITVSFWLKENSTDSSVGLELSSNFNSNDGAFLFNPNASAGRTSVAIQDSVSGGRYRAESFASPANDAWHYYSLVLDNTTSTGDVIVYVDGVAQSTTIDVNNKDQSTAFATDALYLMSRGGTSIFNKGSLDDVRIYNRALSAAEVQQLYALGASKLAVSSKVTNTSCSTGLSCGLIAYWTFDGKDIPWTSSSAATAIDKARGNAGILTSMVQSTSPVLGKTGQALKFDGSTQYVDLNNTTNYNVTSTGNMSICAWVKTTDSNGPIVSLRDVSGAPIFGMYMGYNGLDTNAGHLLPLIRYDGSLGIKSVSSSATINNGKWRFVCMVMDKTNTLLSAYIDTVRYSSTITVTTGSMTFAAKQAIGTDLNWVAAPFGTVDQRYFSGSIDDVRFYNRALSATEVSQLYNLGR